MDSENTTHEEELVEIIDEMDIEDLKSNFTSLMTASILDDPNTEVAV